MESAFEDKFVAFVDILGFTNLVERAERQDGLSLDTLRNLVALLGNEKDVNRIRIDGPSICPEAPRLRRDVNFEITQGSDSVIVSTEVSPAGLIGIAEHCHIVAMRLLKEGFLCRGYVTRGSIFHKGTEFYGTAYQQAAKSEPKVAIFQRHPNDSGTPFIEFDLSVIEYFDAVTDKCVKLMFDRITKTDGNLRAVFPFKRLSHGFIVAGMGIQFDPDRERKNNNVVRGWISTIKSKLRQHLDPTNENAVRKIEHYEAALDKQLEVCADTDRAIDDLCSPYPARPR
jgi:hypothetical protein